MVSARTVSVVGVCSLRPLMTRSDTSTVGVDRNSGSSPLPPVFKGPEKDREVLSALGAPQDGSGIGRGGVLVTAVTAPHADCWKVNGTREWRDELRGRGRN